MNTMDCYFAFHELITAKIIRRYLYKNTDLRYFSFKVSFFGSYEELSDYNVFKFSFRFKNIYKADDILEHLNQALYLSHFKFIKL